MHSRRSLIGTSLYAMSGESAARAYVIRQLTLVSAHTETVEECRKSVYTKGIHSSAIRSMTNTTSLASLQQLDPNAFLVKIKSSYYKYPAVVTRMKGKTAGT